MKLLPSAGSDRAWVWNVVADFADEEPKKEQLAIRFKNPESKYICVQNQAVVIHLLYAPKLDTKPPNSISAIYYIYHGLN